MAYEMTRGTEPIEISRDVHFSLTIDGTVQRFLVSREALEDHFGEPKGKADDKLAAFERGKDRIFAVAARKYGIGTQLVIVVGTFDF